MKLLWACITAVALFASCKSKQAQTETNGEKKNAPVEQKQQPSVPLIQTLEMAEFETGDNYTVLSTALKGDVLSILVQYSGGCETHQFDLFADPRIMKSMPPQQNIVLKHNANGDNCRALITDTIAYDLSPIRMGEKGSIVLRLHTTEERITYSYPQ